MGFRLKTILGVAIIEGTLLLFLVWSSMDYLTRSTQEELTKRAVTTSHLFAAMAKDPVLSTDLATLDSVVGAMLNSPGVIYVRVMDKTQTLIEDGDSVALMRPFLRDQTFEQSGDGIFDIDAEISEGGFSFGRVELGLSVAPLKTLVSDAWARLFGIAAVEMLLVAIFSFFLGTYLTRSLKILTKASVAISQGELGVQVEIKDAKELKATAEAFNTMSQRLLHTHQEMSGSLDNGERLAVRLASSEQRLAAILDAAVDGFVTINQFGIIQDINPAGEQTFGYDSGELIGKNVSCLMPEPYHHEHDSYLSNYLQTGQAKVIGLGREVEGLRKDGTTFPVDLSVSDVFIGDERMFVGLVRDISERKRMEKATYRSEAIKAAIIETNLDALITIDHYGCIVEFSPVAEKMFGYPRKRVLGRELAKVIIPEALQEAHRGGLKRYLDNGENTVLGKRIEVAAIRSNGEEFPVELAVSPIEVEGEVLFTAFIRDISEQKAAENQLREAKQQAEAASEAKSRFLAHMSHEIRSPLNAVLGSVGLLLDSRLDGRQQLCAQTAETSGKALLGVINDILDFSKIEAGQLELDHIKYNLRDLVAGVDEVVAYRTKGNKKLDIVSTLGSGIPAQLMGDPARLRQVLLNLMDNAAKFTECGAVVLTVSVVNAEGTGGVLRFVVEDSGIGIDEQAQQKLFTEFSQVDNSDSTRYGGTGLGLAICRQLVELMGGRIGLESELGNGSRFWFEIPMQADNTEVAEVITEHFNYRLMVVGFSPLARQAIAAQWQVLGCEVTLAGSSEAALGLIAAQRGRSYDFIMLDENFEDSELPVLAKRLRDGCERLILVSSASLLEGELNDQQSGYDRVIFRPLHLDVLLTAISGDVDNTEAVHMDTQEDLKQSDVEPLAKLLLAEDSPANQMVAKALLQREGYRVDIANDGQEAVDAFKSGNYDLILMDLRMPNMNGLEATEAIRAEVIGADIPIIAMTANALQSDIERCLNAGMNDYVSKPVDKNNLLKAIARALDARPNKKDSLPVMMDESLSLLFEEALERLAMDTSPEEVPAMVEIFLNESSLRIGRIRDGLQSMELESLCDEVHTIKSIAGTFGALRLQSVAAAMEQACREGEHEKAQQLGAGLLALYDETYQVYRSRFKVA